MKVKWTKEAREQLKEILRFYIKRNQSVNYGIRLKHGVYKLVKHFQKNPCYGEQIGDDENIRRVSFGHFVIIYETRPNAIEIFSFRDGRRIEESCEELE